MKVKIYGHGWVGRSVQKLFPDAIIADPKYGHYPSSKDKPADVAFVCVPTPLSDGRLDCSLVEQVIQEAPEDLIIVRSTVMPGTCDQFHSRNIVYQPEYLGESVNHPLFDEKTIPFMILGGLPMNRRRAIELYQYAYSANIRIRQVSNYEAEIIKLAENRAILFHVAHFQELYDALQAAGVDYYEVVQAVYGDDPRFHLYWSFVFPDKRGANSKCLPKDNWAYCAWCESVGFDPVLTKGVLAYNETLIREQVTA